MSKAALSALSQCLDTKVIGTTDFRGDEESLVASADWQEAAQTLKAHPELDMSQFIDLTAVDYPEREGLP